MKNFGEIEFVVGYNRLGNVTEFKYLGLIINQHLTCHNHIDTLQKKVTQRLGVLKRIKHLLPIYFSNSLLIHEENTKENHKRIVS